MQAKTISKWRVYRLNLNPMSRKEPHKRDFLQTNSTTFPFAPLFALLSQLNHLFPLALKSQSTISTPTLLLTYKIVTIHTINWNKTKQATIANNFAQAFNIQWLLTKSQANPLKKILMCSIVISMTRMAFVWHLTV